MIILNTLSDTNIKLRRENIFEYREMLQHGQYKEIDIQFWTFSS